MLHVRAGKTSVERKPKVEGGTVQEAGTVLWERQAEKMQGSHAGSVHSERKQRRQQSSGTLQTNRQEEGGRRRQVRKRRIDRRGEGGDEADAQAMQDA